LIWDACGNCGKHVQFDCDCHCIFLIAQGFWSMAYDMHKINLSQLLQRMEHLTLFVYYLFIRVMKENIYIGIPLSHTQFRNSQRYVNLIITEKLYPQRPHHPVTRV
jgi:hypothetical protein